MKIVHEFVSKKELLDHVLEYCSEYESVYVGITTDINGRFKDHKKNSKMVCEHPKLFDNFMSRVFGRDLKISCRREVERMIVVYCSSSRTQVRSIEKNLILSLRDSVGDQIKNKRIGGSVGKSQNAIYVVYILLGDFEEILHR